jgi:hypothetical protein
MTKLNDTQAVILANASQSFDGNVLPLPGSLRERRAGQGNRRTPQARADRGADDRQHPAARRLAQPGLAPGRRRPLDPALHHEGRPRRHRLRAGGGQRARRRAGHGDGRRHGRPKRRRGEGERHSGRGRARGRQGGGRRGAGGAQGPRRHQAGDADRDASQPRRRHDGGDRRRHRLAAAHGPWRDGGRAEEEARAGGHLRKGRWERSSLPSTGRLTIRPPDSRRPHRAAASCWVHGPKRRSTPSPSRTFVAATAAAAARHFLPFDAIRKRSVRPPVRRRHSSSRRWRRPPCPMMIGDGSSVSLIRGCLPRSGRHDSRGCMLRVLVGEDVDGLSCRNAGIEHT